MPGVAAWNTLGGFVILFARLLPPSYRGDYA